MCICRRDITSPGTSRFYSINPSRSIHIEEECSESRDTRHMCWIFIPTAFSPNGDRLNDRVIPFGGPEVELIESFMVFDRWGNLLHRTAGFMPGDELFGWDGSYRGQVMNPGVFVAVVEVRFKNGTVKTFSGDVLLVR